MLDSHANNRKIALGFTDRRLSARGRNDKIFSQLGYELVSTAGAEHGKINDALENLFAQRSQENLTILVDYTSMTRVWYGGVLRFLRDVRASVPRIDVVFTYAASTFSQPRLSAQNAHMGPVAGFSSLELPDRKTALILGLGYERDRGLGLSEYVEAAETFAFYADPALDKRFSNAVLKNNEQLLRALGAGRTIAYNLSDLRSTSAKLSSLATGLSVHGFRVILAPLGPKPFALLCFLLATKASRFDVWRVSAGTEGTAYNRAALGPVISCRAVFEA